MPRPLRIEYAGARYHLMSRGDRREDIFLDAVDRKRFLALLGKTCGKTGWEVQAYCLMSNHWHAVVETPQPNLALGMRWLLGTYTQSFHRRHRQWGHLFGGRYKAQLPWAPPPPERGGLLSRRARELPAAIAATLRSAIPAHHTSPDSLRCSAE